MPMSDSTLLQDSTQLTNLKKVLASDFGVSLENLITAVQEEESRQSERENLTLNVPKISKTRLNEILTADGITPTATAYSDWLEEAVDDAYEEYLSDGKFDSEDDGSSEEPTE